MQKDSCSVIYPDTTIKGETHVVLMGSGVMASESRSSVESCLRRKMLRATGECDVCTANGVGWTDRCSGQRHLAGAGEKKIAGNGVKMGDASLHTGQFLLQL